MSAWRWSQAPRSALVLGGFAIVAAIALSVAQYYSRGPIERAQQARFHAELQMLVPAAAYDNNPLTDTVTIADPRLGTAAPVTVHRARRGSKAVAVLFPVIAPDGYNGAIHLLIGIYADGRIAGVRVTAHRETPGLGDKIDAARSDWIHGFAGRSLDNPPPRDWAVRKDGGVFDQFSGATITPRAVVKAVHRALNVHAEHRLRLYADNAAEDGQ